MVILEAETLLLSHCSIDFFNPKSLAHSTSLMRLGGVGLTTYIFMDKKNKVQKEATSYPKQQQQNQDYNFSYQIYLTCPLLGQG